MFHIFMYVKIFHLIFVQKVFIKKNYKKIIKNISWINKDYLYLNDKFEKYWKSNICKICNFNKFYTCNNLNLIENENLNKLLEKNIKLN